MYKNCINGNYPLSLAPNQTYPVPDGGLVLLLLFPSSFPAGRSCNISLPSMPRSFSTLQSVRFIFFLRLAEKRAFPSFLKCHHSLLVHIFQLIFVLLAVRMNYYVQGVIIANAKFKEFSFLGFLLSVDSLERIGTKRWMNRWMNIKKNSFSLWPLWGKGQWWWLLLPEFIVELFRYA